MIKRDWFPENRLPVLVNMGYDEFGNGFENSTLLGNSKVPVNLTLEQPTLNRYIDTALAAQVMAMEVLVTDLNKFSTGVHALPDEIDEWVVHTWHDAWPNENLDSIREELGL
jgi:S-adenosylhomocysteine hydrolase